MKPSFAHILLKRYKLEVGEGLEKSSRNLALFQDQQITLVAIVSYPDPLTCEPEHCLPCVLVNQFASNHETQCTNKGKAHDS